MATMESVPYFVLRLENDGNASLTCHRAKVMFTVPAELAVALASYPIVCCGSFFTLELENPMSTLEASSPSNKRHNNNPTAFLTTVLESPRPEETAQDIARRLAIRLENIDSFQIATAGGASGFLGL
jgi:hypothetical protein